MEIWKEFVRKKKNIDEETDVTITTCSDPEKNVYEFGLLLIEIISGKTSYSNTHGFILNWVTSFFLYNCLLFIIFSDSIYISNQLFSFCTTFAGYSILDGSK